MKEFIDYKYLTKDQLRYRIKSSDFEKNWDTISQERIKNSIKLPLIDKDGNNLFFNLTAETIENINKIETLTKDASIENIIPVSVKHESLIESLIEEAFSSSAIEGAHSTRKRISELVLKNDEPQDKSEKMIMNNFNTLLFTLDNLNRNITNDYIIEIWQKLTVDTLDESDITSRFRNDKVFIRNAETIVYEGPNPEKIETMMNLLIEYTNTIEDMNPIVKASIIHYYFVYIHPFFDGNGRTARALMNLYLIKNDMDFFKYYSISKILTDKRSTYYKSIKYSEDFNSDVTYFIDFYSQLLLDTIVEIRNTYINSYGMNLINQILIEKNISLNSRQEKVVNNLFKGSKSVIDIKLYTKMMGVVQETARKDLEYLNTIGILKKIKRSNKYIYTLFDLNNIEENLSEL